MKEALLAATLLLTALAGCISTDDGSAESIDETATPAGANATVTNIPPTAALAADVLNGTAPLAVNFTVTALDADGGNVSWELDFNGDGAGDVNGTADNATISFTFLEVGNHTITLNVTDGNETSAANVTIAVSAAEPVFSGPITISSGDSGSDALSDLTEIQGLTATLDAENLVLVMDVAMIWPSTDVASEAIYAFQVNGVLFNTFVRYAIDTNPMTWDVANGGYMAAGTATWTSTTATVVLPLEYLSETHDMTGPFEVTCQTGYGSLNTYQVDDTGPDDGAIIIG